MLCRQLFDEAIDARLEIAPRDVGTHRRGKDRRRQHLVEHADPVAHDPRELQHLGARVDVAVADGHRRAERDERARPVADRVAHHLGDLAAEGTLPFLQALVREDVVLEHEVVGDRHRHDDEVRTIRAERRVEEPGLGLLQLAAVTASAFGIEKEIVLLQDLADVRLQRDEVRRIFHVAADRNRASDVLVNQSERSAEQIDARGDERRPDAVVVEHERLDEVIGVALVVRRVHDAVAAHRRRHVVQVLVLALDLAQDGIQRMLQRAIELVALRRAQLLEIGADLLARILQHILARKYGLRDLVEH